MADYGTHVVSCCRLQLICLTAFINFYFYQFFPICHFAVQQCYCFFSTLCLFVSFCRLCCSGLSHQWTSLVSQYLSLLFWQFLGIMWDFTEFSLWSAWQKNEQIDSITGTSYRKTLPIVFMSEKKQHVYPITCTRYLLVSKMKTNQNTGTALDWVSLQILPDSINKYGKRWFIPIPSTSVICCHTICCHNSLLT